MGPDEVVLRRSLIVPLPWRIREHPERHRDPRGTLVREAVVALAVRYPPILETLRRIEHVEPLQAALRAYAHAADAVVELLGLTHRRDLLLSDDLPMPTQFDLRDAVALAQLNPTALEVWHVAVATLHVMLDRPLYAASVRASLERIPALKPTTAWLVPSLLRWLHVRYYEALYGPFPTAEGQSAQVPLEWEEAVVVRAPGPRRRLFAHAPREGGSLLLSQTWVWWAVEVEEVDEREAVQWWHRRMTNANHRKRYGGPDAEADPADDWCKRAVRNGLKEVHALLAD